jgi:putative Mg2+ transporter-C (MgtC) family protein
MAWIDQLQGLELVLLAGGLGALVGLEREFSDKPAGLRTHILVCASSAMFMVLGEAILEEFKDEGAEYINSDPVRVLQAIVVGISFLGAGTIIQGRKRVDGLTTAASVFLTAGVGVAVAVGQLVLAVGTTLFAVAVLGVLGWLELRAKAKLKNNSPERPESNHDKH